MLGNNSQSHRTDGTGSHRIATAGGVRRGCFRGNKKKGMKIIADRSSYGWKTRKCFENVAAECERAERRGYSEGDAPRTQLLLRVAECERAGGRGEFSFLSTQREPIAPLSGKVNCYTCSTFVYEEAMASTLKHEPFHPNTSKYDKNARSV